MTLAKLELFADSAHVEEFSKDQRALLLTANRLSQIMVSSESMAGTPAVLETLVTKHGDAYADFVQGVSLEAVTERVDNAQLYDKKFRDIVKGLKEDIDTKTLDEIPGYLGGGSNGHAFAIEVDGQTYAVKFGGAVQMNYELKALHRGKGIPNLSQLVAYSFEDTATIMECLPGKNVSEYNVNTRPQYTTEEIVNLISTVEIMSKNGLVIDPKESNFMYDPDVGFSILDYHISEGHYQLPDAMLALPHALTFDYRIHDYGMEDRAYDDVQYQYTLNKLKMEARVLHILNDVFPDIFKQTLVENEIKKADERSSTHNHGYFNKDALLRTIKNYSEAFDDAEQREAVFNEVIADIEALGFF